MLERRLASTLAAVVLFPAGMSAPRAPEVPPSASAPAAATADAGERHGVRTAGLPLRPR